MRRQNGVMWNSRESSSNAAQMRQPRTSGGPTSLHKASRGWYVELALFLLERNAYATAQTGGRWAPLYEASERGHMELARVLLERGADATAQTSERSTPSTSHRQTPLS
jgi:ankyrin repeat protein